MAKKKKSKSKISELLLALTAILGIVAFIMMFMTKLSLTGKAGLTTGTMEWKEVFFNQKSTTGSTTTTTSYGVTLGFIAYLAILQVAQVLYLPSS